jgi:hypothetical protein
MQLTRERIITTAVELIERESVDAVYVWMTRGGRVVHP